MKLFLMRHAHTEDANNTEDILRNLTELGKNEALIAADFLSRYNIDKILVSSAARTRQTVDILQIKLQCKTCEIISELYGSSFGAIIDIIAKQDDKDKTILIVAHNPGIFKAALIFSPFLPIIMFL